MNFDYADLTCLIAAQYVTQYNFSLAMGLSERSISLKLNNRVRWKDVEIKKAAQLLNIKLVDIPDYFFKEEV